MLEVPDAGGIEGAAEQAYLKLQAWLAQPAPRPLLLLVPRHPQRFDTVAQIVRDAQLDLQRRSQWTDAPPPGADAADVWLGDSLGEMPLYYAASDVALLGGSFAPLEAPTRHDARPIHARPAASR